jgi:hypothetical protein
MRVPILCIQAACRPPALATIPRAASFAARCANGAVFSARAVIAATATAAQPVRSPLVAPPCAPFAVAIESAPRAVLLIVTPCVATDVTTNTLKRPWWIRVPRPALLRLSSPCPRLCPRWVLVQARARAPLACWSPNLQLLLLFPSVPGSCLPARFDVVDVNSLYDGCFDRDASHHDCQSIRAEFICQRHRFRVAGQRQSPACSRNRLSLPQAIAVRTWVVTALAACVCSRYATASFMPVHPHLACIT